MAVVKPDFRRPSGEAEALAHPEGDARAKILVVDDDERNLVAIRSTLEDLADVVVASSGEEGLRALLDKEFAVILLDVIMPGLDGYETARLIRQREKSKRTPIVFLSAVNKDEFHLKQGYAMGAVDYVFKPVEPMILRSKVSVFVDLYAMTREIQNSAREEQRLLDANFRAQAERLKAEQELRAAEQRQSAIIQSLPIILYLEELDATPRIPKFVSGNFTALTGFTFEEVQANPKLWIERLHPEDRDKVLEALAMRGEGQVRAVEYRWRCADGCYRYFLDQAVLLRDDDGQPVEYAGTLFDLTDRKMLEDQLFQAQKMDAIGKLTGGIAHDFNNLLAAVLGGIGQIERRINLTEDEQRILGMTRHAARQGAELVKRLLAFSRRQQLQPAAIDVKNLAANLSKLLEHTLGGLVRIEWRMGDKLWNAYADETQLELAVMNLVINARDAMPEGGLITLSCVNRTISGFSEVNLPDGDYVVLSVEDEGCGISEAHLEKVMEPFFTTKDIGKGTGLGLSMAYGFARQSGGGVDIKSVVDKGTCVEIWLPRAVTSPVSVRDDADAPEAERTKSLRVLLVDDHELVRETTAKMLKDLGHDVSVMTDGQAALSNFENGPENYDLIVTDYAMPLQSGGELIEALRKVRPQFPSIIISGYADADAIVSKPQDVIFLAKPFSPRQLDRAIYACVGGA